MARRWVLGIVGAFAVLAVAGVGFAAFTASATVTGEASQGTVSLKITDFAFFGCHYVTGAPAPGTFDSASENAVDTVLSLKVGNLTPAAYCSVKVFIMNTGTVPINITAFLNETSGICPPGGLNCYDVYDSFGLSAFGGVTSASLGAPIAPGVVINDLVSVGIPAGSVSAPPVGIFSVYYLGTAGF
jgi:hypothetical protein